MTALADLFICLRFFSRLPIPTTQREMAHGTSGLARAVLLVPIAGAIIGIIPALVLLVGAAVGLPALLGAPLAIAALLATTGALHEDGLADCADGFGGGRTRERKLEIMRDSRIGTFGACAIALSLYIRAGALGIIAAHDPWLGAMVFVAAAVVSRTACLLPLAILPAARPAGLGATAGQPTRQRLGCAMAIAAGLSFVVLPFGAGIGRLGIALALAFASALSVCGLAWRQIGGQTGDVAGAAQQVAEAAFVLVLATTLSGPHI